MSDSNFVRPRSELSDSRWIEEDHPEWARRLRAAETALLPWVEAVKPLQGATVLEYGSGEGAVSAALSPHVERHIGYDIDPGSIDFARRKLEHRGVTNSELHAVPADEILEAVAAHKGEIDVLALYAVLEHMNVQERLALLELAPSLLKPGGVIAVIELPNRLVTGDHHTSQLPFYSQLPEDLALRYWDRSPRPDFHAAMERASAEEPLAREALTRWGRGASFHEFELVFGELATKIAATNYDPLLLGERPVMPEELALARELETLRPDLPPCFSRYWIDFVLVPDGVDPATRHIRPWTMETAHGAGRWTRWDNIELLGDARMPVALPTATGRLVIGVALPGDAPVVRVHGGEREWTLTPEGDPAGTRYVTLEADLQAFELSFDRSGYLTFLGYETPSGR